VDETHTCVRPVTEGGGFSCRSSAFFWGPKTYLSMMFKKNRWMISLAVLGTMGFTLFCVFAVRCRPHSPLHLRLT